MWLLCAEEEQSPQCLFYLPLFNCIAPLEEQSHGTD